LPQITAGQHILIMGPSGSGKTSILRALAGLWRVGEGRVAMHVEDREVIFLPQRPYMVVGSLREQLLYPKW
jgi:putative ATP-binding cassette transporter